MEKHIMSDRTLSYGLISVIILATLVLLGDLYLALVMAQEILK